MILKPKVILIVSLLFVTQFSFSSTLSPKIILETERMLLRECILEDAAALAPMLAHEEVMKYSLHGPMTFEQTQERVRRYISYYSQHGFGRWAIIHKATKKVIGYCGLTWAPPIDGQTFIEIGYRLHCDCWGQGLATEIVTAVKKYAFDALKIPVLIAVVEPENKGSIRVVEKLGMQFWKQSEYHHLFVNVYRLAAQ